jgi:CO/xanthine dehydrogenase FAD-binding subunit
MKQRLTKPEVLISLKKLEGLRFLRREGDRTAIGAMTPLADVLASEETGALHPAYFKAVKMIGAPPIQHFRGTVGGNLCLETRCLQYNQSRFWRSGRPVCHKEAGEICYAEENSDRCRSANQSDGACALMALGATIVLASARERKSIPIEDFFTGKGENPFALAPEEMVIEVQLPGPARLSGFQKLTYRSAIDFALVSAAAGFELNDGRIFSARLVVGGAGAAPLLLKEAGEILEGKSPRDDEAIRQAADKARKHASAFMVENLGSNLAYRQKMSAVMVERAIREALGRIEK